MNESKSKFDKVLSSKDVFVIAFGAMIGWGWIVMAGEWIGYGGSIGAMIAFAIGGFMVLFVGLTYAELTSAMPECGGEHIFSLRAFGKNGSFICTWAIILGYVGVVAFEACAFPTVIKYIAPSLVTKGYMYTIGGFDVYASWVAVAVIAAVIITIINYKGAKTAAIVQTILTVVIGMVGIALIAMSVVRGETANLDPMFAQGSEIGGIFKVAVMTPFMLMGFDVIPQAAEEINIPFKKIGKIIIFSIMMAVAWYVLIIMAVSLVMTKGEMGVSELVTADAMKKAYFNSNIASSICIIGGIMGIVTSWNSFFMGGSRAISALAESHMAPSFFAEINEKTKTPTKSVLLVGLIAVAAPFFGKSMMTWITNAGSFAVCLAYMMVSASFLKLRKSEPDMKRPYKVKNAKLVGGMAVLTTAVMCSLYILPGESQLITQEWIIVGGWILLGIVFYIYARHSYGDAFGTRRKLIYEDVKETKHRYGEVVEA